MKLKIEKPSWKVRRFIIFTTLIYCACMVTYLAVWAESTPLREQVVLALIGLVVSVIGSYIFGAVWDDKNHKQEEEQPVDFNDYYGGEE